MYDEKCMRKADDLLRQAAATSNMKERGRLIDEALHWHMLASEGRPRGEEPGAEIVDGEGDNARR